MLEKRVVKSFSIILSLLFFSLGYSQANYEVLYRVDFCRDTLEVTNITSEIMSLQIGERTSLYKSNQKVITDSLKKIALEKSSRELNSSGRMTLDFSNIPKVNLTHEVFKKNDSIQIYDKLSGDYYHYYPYNKVIWKIGNEEKKINGYLCRQAFGNYKGREYVAWYTDEIPFPEGPYVFKNLPGLILEIADTKGYFNFSLVSVQEKPVTITPIENSIEIDYFTFIKKRREISENPLAKYHGLLKKPLSPEIKERIISRAQKKNNFLD